VASLLTKSGDEISDLPTTPQDLLDRLRSLNIDFKLHHHEPVFSVADSHRIDSEIPGAATRNLFLKDKKDKMFLVTLRAHTKVDLNKLAPLIGAGRLSFGSPERLLKYLGVRPGSVTPFAMVNDQDHQVQIFLEQDMMREEWVNFHPLINSMTVGLTPTDLLKALDDFGAKPQIIDLKDAKPEQEE
jgi:Ala-tRNA(Pro) deacylase